MKIAILGAGHVGTTLGTALQSKGHTVIYGARDPASRTERNMNIKTVADALIGAEAVILATPWTATEALVVQHADALAGKIVIDATNPIHPSLARLAIAANSSGAELLQSKARQAKFFKAFNSTGASVMAHPRFAAGKAAMFVAGPDGADKDIVLRIVADVGFEPVDAGELKAARQLEHLAMLWIQLAFAKGQGRDFAFVIARRQDDANRDADTRVRLGQPQPLEAE
jgi:8-hydroxy-5-deazaflavin:NADPH oxidoreductase